MNKQPFFTVGVPVYNTEKWLRDTIDSIISQDFTDFELILCNDGSTDTSLDILKEYATCDSRIKIINRTNCGVSAARNAIIAAACGEYIYFIDSDDLMCEKALSTAYSVLQQNNMPDVLETSFYIQNGNGLNKSKFTAVYPGDKYFDSSLTKDERAVLMWLDTTYSVCVFAKFIRTAFLHKAGIVFSTRYTMGEDNDFVFQLHRKADTIAFADFCPNIYINPREGSVVTEMSTKSLYSAISYMTELFDDSKYYELSEQFKSDNQDKYNKKIYEYFTHNINSCIDYLHKNMPPEELWAKIDVVDKSLDKYRKYLPVNKNDFLFILIRFLGIRKTFTILYKYLKFKGVIQYE